MSTRFLETESRLTIFFVFNKIEMATLTRGGSRIPRRRGRQPSRGRAPTYDFAKFCEKLYEIEKILGRRGAHAGGAPPKSATANLKQRVLEFLFFEDVSRRD